MRTATRRTVNIAGVLLVLSVLLPSSALAHTTGSASPVFVVSGSPPGGGTWSNPRLQLTGNGWEFDLKIGGANCSSAATNIDVFTQHYNASMAPIGGWQHKARYQWPAFCNEINTTGKHMDSWATGTAHVELRVTSSTSATLPTAPDQATLLYRAKDASFDEGPPAPQSLEVVSTSPGGKTLTADMVAALAMRAGWTGEDLVRAVAVAKAESSFRTKAISYTGCCHGLWQVNLSSHGVTAEQMFDPVQNATKAFSIFTAAGGWQPWEAFTNGAYQQYMDEARAAVNRQLESGGQAYFAIANAPSSSTGSVSLGWTITGCASCSYNVQRGTAAEGPFVSIGTTSSIVFTDRQATSGTTYYYRVRSENSNGSSSWSNVVGVTTGAADPAGEIPEDYVGPTGDGAGNPDAGETEDGEDVSCGLNMFCWIKAALKWAFVPTDGAGVAWTEFRTTLSTRPPFAAVDVGVQFFEAVSEGLNETMGTGWHGEFAETQFGCVGGAAQLGSMEAADRLPSWNPICLSTILVQAHERHEGNFSLVRNLLRVGLWGLVALKVIRMLGLSIGIAAATDFGAGEGAELSSGGRNAEFLAQQRAGR